MPLLKTFAELPALGELPAEFEKAVSGRAVFRKPLLRRARREHRTKQSRKAEALLRRAPRSQEWGRTVGDGDHRSPELENLRAALTWTAALPEGSEQLLHLTGLLGRFWRDREHMQEGIRWLEAALRRVPPTAPPKVDGARALN